MLLCHQQPHHYLQLYKKLLPNLLGDTMSLRAFETGRDGGIRTHTTHALNVSPAANWATPPLKSGTGGGTRTHTGRSLKPMPAANWATPALLKMVVLRGFEPPRLTALPPQGSVYCQFHHRTF